MVKDDVVQIGVEGERQLCSDFRKNLSINDIRKLLKQCKTFVSVDSFLHHLAWKE